MPSPVAFAETSRDADTAVRQVPLDRAEADHNILLPGLRQRVRECLWFLALSQTIYFAMLPFSVSESFELRFALCGFRLVVLYSCIYALRGAGSRRQTLVLITVGLFTQLAVGVGMSAVRRDVMPMALLTIALTYIASALIPWGARAQAVLAGASAAGIGLATAAMYWLSAPVLGLDNALTLLTGFAVTIYIAHSLEGARSRVEQHLQDARHTDAELAELRAQLERRVVERTAELEMANRELESFSHTVSHDLRSPLRAIAGFSQMIVDESGEKLDEDVHTHLGKIRAASRRMDGLIDDMLRLSRVSRSALRYEAVDLAAVARSVAENLAAEDPHRKVEFTIGGVPKVSGDLGLLHIAVENLMRNAWKFTGTRETGHITVSGIAGGDDIVVTIEDDGIGFDPRFRQKLFLPFERIHDHPHFPGTGVGLATVARIVRRHGGSVDAVGAPDHGAKFSIRLPRQRPAAS
ncbi:MAG TPA: HAMP domain-containing sensor histidine kinase [Candidatus Limnocylindrales bacterium]|nr:HAMP domain-containing sensor histidine kinase [Candidatus Limnocylindrales bacterium]